VKIVHIQTGVPSSGDSTFRLNQYLNDNGYTSRIIVLNSLRKSSTIAITGGMFSSLIVVLNNMFESLFSRNNKPGTGTFSWPFFGLCIEKNEHIQSADIIVIAWAIGGFLSFRSFRKIVRLNKPTVIFMRDMWYITGGCHHSFSCDGYLSGCSDCHLFDKKYLKRLVRSQVAIKKKIASFKNVYFASPSLWLKNCGESSFILDQRKVEWLPNIVPDKIFKVGDKSAARDAFSLPQNKKLIGFGAKKGVSGDYKGWSFLVEAMKKLYESTNVSNEDIELVVFGTEGDAKISNLLPYKCHFLGYLYDDFALAAVYRTLDVFVTPSLADNFPSTVLESLSCGTPVVGFEIGGIPDIIDHLKNGYLAKYRSSDDLANGIQFCLNMEISGLGLRYDLQPETTLDNFKRYFNKIKQFDAHSHSYE
jgi:glycosyltransferase involved in cell wall biosynthesis